MVTLTHVVLLLRYDYDTDKGMLVLKMVDLNGKDIGMIR